MQGGPGDHVELGGPYIPVSNLMENTPSEHVGLDGSLLEVLPETNNKHDHPYRSPL